MKVKLGLSTQPLQFTTVNLEEEVNLAPGSSEIYGDRENLLYLIFENNEDYLNIINDKELYNSEEFDFNYEKFVQKCKSTELDDLPDGGCIFENCIIESTIIHTLQSGNKAYELLER